MTLIKVLVILNIITHVWFLIFEMFLWRTPLAMKTFKMSRELANSSAVLAANQGLYNGFLAAGLIYALLASDVNLAHSLELFFLSCISIAGIYGAITASKKIFFIQALPALLGLAAILFA